MSPAPVRRLALWLLALALIGAALWRLGTGTLAGPALAHPSAWSAWASGRDPLTAGLAVIRLAVLAVTAYLTLVTVLHLLAAVCRSVALIRLATLVTVPPVRRVFAGVAGLGLSASLAIAPAAVALPHTGGPVTTDGPPATQGAPSGSFATMREELPEPPPPPPSVTTTNAPTGEHVATERELVADRTADQGDPATAPATATPAAPTAPPTTAAPPAASAPAATATPASIAPPAGAPAPLSAAPVGEWTVAAGENFWFKAADVLAASWGRQPSDAEIVPYWRTLIAANRAALADPANPDLIFPGQRFTVPAPPP